METNKEVIYGDGIDSATITLYGDYGATVNVIVNAETHVIAIDKTYPNANGAGYATIEITCDTPNETILVSCGNERITIYSVGAP